MLISDRTIRELINSLAITRNRQILRLRFGFPGEIHTLEQIGKKYGITRERVRQIEKDSLAKISGVSKNKKLSSALKKLQVEFKKNGGVVTEKRILNLGASRQAILFLLALGKNYFLRPGNQKYFSHWSNSPEKIKKADAVINYYRDWFKKKFAPVSRQELLDNSPHGLKQNFLLSYLEISKLIEKNPFGEWGLASWPCIRPKGVRDKAILILSREKKALHFTKITALINQVNFRDGRKAQEQTVHNELIKDPAFKWIDRGVYALSGK